MIIKKEIQKFKKLFTLNLIYFPKYFFCPTTITQNQVNKFLYCFVESDKYK
jgi:hypothetical protein